MNKIDGQPLSLQIVILKIFNAKKKQTQITNKKRS